MNLWTDKLLESRPLLWLGLIAVVAAVVASLLRDARDSREPPYIESKFPLIGHVFSLWRDGAAYFTQLDRRYHHGLYTLPILPLPILKSKMYVAGSPEWATAVQKHSSTVDLYTLSARALDTLMMLDQQSMSVIHRDLHGDKRKTQDNLMFVLKDVMLKALAPGPDLDELNRNLLRGVEPLLNGLAPGQKGPQKVMFWAWIRQHISEVSMAAAYGKDNPVARDTGLVEDFWTFDATAASLMMPLPALLARKGHLARWRFINGFADYAARGGYKQASRLIQNRAKAALSQGLEIRQYGHLESNFAPGLLSNTVPATFWLISRVFEDPDLLAEIRAEIDACTEEEGTGTNKRTINVARLQAECPLFSSVFMETLRTTSPLNTYRYVREDTLITNNTTKESYLLKADHLIQLASTVLHARPDVWGQDPDQFDARRFLPVVERARAASGGKGAVVVDPAAPFRDADGKMHAGSFRPFGGGVHLCPGRFFAQTGIQAGAAMFIAGFDMKNTHGSGRYVPPRFKDARGFMFLSIIKPESDVEVLLGRRKGYEDTVWDFNLSR